MTSDFERYRQAKREHGGRIDTDYGLYGWSAILVLLVATGFAWYFALPGYRAMVSPSPPATESIDQASDRPDRNRPGNEDSLMQPGTILTDRDPDELALAFLDVGQGDAMFIQTPNNRNILIDTGEGSNPDYKFARAVDAANELILPFFERNKIDELDYLITSHPHSDHIGAAYTIINEMPIDEIWAAGYDHPSRSKKDMLTAIKERKQNADLTFKVPKEAGGTLREGQELDLGPSVKGWLLRTAPEAENVNQSSLVLLIYYGETGMLFTGDTERAGEKELIREWGDQLDVDVLKVGHHGSRTSTIQPFAETVSPDYSVFTVGHYNTFGHPTEEVLSRLRRLGSTNYRTDRHGTIYMFTDGQDISVETVPAVSAVNE